MRIVVTGFGPFGDFATNPSAVVVDALADVFDDCADVELITETVAVDYAKAMGCSNRISDTINADFTVHVGVDRNANRTVHLETRSFRNGYTHPDVRGSIPSKNQCELCVNNGITTENGVDDDHNAVDDSAPTTLQTVLDCELLKARVQKALAGCEGCLPVQIDISKNPGRYLCAYIYYCSLLKSNGRSLFVHIPPFDGECTPEVLVKCLKQIVLEIYHMRNGAIDHRGK